MVRAWTRARNAVALCASRKIPTTLRECLADALRQTWDEAKSARSLAQWQAEEAARWEAAKTLDARTREIMQLETARDQAVGIESTAAYLALRADIDARLAALRAAA